jgi:uridine kinase
MRIVSPQGAPENGPMIVGIIGGSGSGKSWLAARLARALGEQHAAAICQDSFYRDLSHLPEAARCEVNFDHPNALDWAAFRKCLIHAASARAARVPIYNFATHTREQKEALIEPRPVVIFDGLWLLHRPALRRFFNFTVFIDAAPALCLQRRVARDCAERGRTADEVTGWFAERVLPMQKQFVEPQRRLVDLILPAPVETADVALLTEKISNLRAKNL